MNLHVEVIKLTQRVEELEKQMAQVLEAITSSSIETQKRGPGRPPNSSKAA